MFGQPPPSQEELREVDEILVRSISWHQKKDKLWRIYNLMLKFSKVRDVKSPCRAHPTDAGIDFFVPNDFIECYCQPGGSVLIPSGIKAKVPDGYALIFFNKSGIATKSNLAVGAQVVDQDYQGEIHLHLYNFSSDTPTLIRSGQKIIQGILIQMNYMQTEEVPLEELYEAATARGEGGFGSTCRP